MVNKTYLLVGGTSVVSLAIGAAGGYFLSKKRFDEQLDEKIAVEVEATKKYYSVLLMQAKENKPTPAELAAQVAVYDQIPIDDEGDEKEVEEPSDEEIAEAEKRAEVGKAALTNYQGYAAKPDLSTVAPTTNNIFETTRKPKKVLPPRDETGKFLPTHTVKEPEQTPYIITHEEFLQNDPEHDQENVLYFVRDKTVIMVADNEPVDIGRIGEVNLTLFPQTPKDEPSIICVRNEGLQIDYEIQLTHESLTEHMGLGESDEDLLQDEEHYTFGS